MASRDDMVSTADDTDELSPTALILKQLDRQGVPRTAANIRRAVQANAREGGASGPDPVAGLRNTAAEEEAPSKPTARKAASKSSGGGGSSVNPPSVNLGGNPYGDEGPLTDPSKPTPNTAATPRPSPGTPVTAGDTIVVDPGTGIPGTVSKAGAPPGTGDDSYDPTAPVIAGIIAAGKKLGDTLGFGQQNMGNMPMPPSGRMTDINPNTIGLDPVVQQPSPMEIAMQKSIAPPAAPPTAPPPAQIGQGGIAGAPPAAATDVQLPGVRPYTPDVPGMIRNTGRLPAGINPLDIDTSAPGPRTRIMPRNMPDNAPRVPMPSRVGAPPGASEVNPVGRLLRAIMGGIR